MIWDMYNITIYAWAVINGKAEIGMTAIDLLEIRIRGPSGYGQRSKKLARAYWQCP